MKSLMLLALLSSLTVMATDGYAPNTGTSAPGTFKNPGGTEDVMPESKNVPVEKTTSQTGQMQSEEVMPLPGPRVLNPSPNPTPEMGETDKSDKVLTPEDKNLRQAEEVRKFERVKKEKALKTNE